MHNLTNNTLIEQAKELLVKWWLFDNLVTIKDLDEWSYKYIENNPYDTCLPVDILSTHLMSDKVATLYSIVVGLDEGFTDTSVECEKIAARLFLIEAEKYLDEMLSPMIVCNLINSIESYFLGAPRDLQENIAYYPEWLGNLYNSCDWCDDSWTHEDPMHLKKDIIAQIPLIQKWTDK